MNPYAYSRSRRNFPAQKPEASGVSTLSAVKSIFTEKINTAVAFAIVLFAAGSVASLLAIAYAEISSGDFAPFYNNHQLQARVLGVASYGYNQPVCGYNTANCLNHMLIGFNNKGWQVRIDYQLMPGIVGSIRVNGWPFMHNITGSGSGYTGYDLVPGRTYNFILYKNVRGRLTRLTNLSLTAPPAPQPEPVPAPPSYGYIAPVPAPQPPYPLPPVPQPPYPLPPPQAPAPRIGQLINLKETIYYVGANGLYGIPSEYVLNSWGWNYNQVTEANSAERTLSQIGIVPSRDPGCNSPVDQIAGRCGSVTTATSTQYTLAFYNAASPIIPITSATCGTKITFNVINYPSSQIWLTQYKNGSATSAYYDQIDAIPDIYTTVCNQDEGIYDNYAYPIVNGQKGTTPLGYTRFTVNPSTSAQPSIKITSPNGGEVWNKGSIYDIKWNSSNVSKIYIKLRKGSDTYNGTSGAVSGVIDNFGSFRWTVPTDLPDGSDYAIRVLSDNGSVIDDSDAPFTVVSSTTTSTPASIGFYKPNSVIPFSSATCGETIIFRVDNINSNQVWLTQYKDGGSAPYYDKIDFVPDTYTTVCDQNHNDAGTYVNYVYSLVNGQKGPFLGSTTFTVNGNSSSSSPTASLSANNQKNISVNVGDSINYVWSAVNADSADSVWSSDKADTCGFSNTTQNVPWVANTTSGSRIATVTSCQTGVTYTIIYRANKAGFSPVTSAVTVKVNGAATVFGSPAFYKNGSKVTAVTCGDVYTFQVDGYSGNQVWLEQTKNGASNYSGVYNLPSTYTAVCGKDEGTYVISVYSVSNGQRGLALLGYTTFTINTASSTTSAVSIKVLSPNGGETWQAGNQYTLSWSTQNLPNTAQVVVEIQKGNTVVKRYSGVPNTGSQAILMPADLAVGTDYKVNVVYYYSSTQAYIDSSDSNFSILEAQTNSLAPTASLTLNDQKNITVNVGDTINSVWSATNADSADSVWSSDKVDTCNFAATNQNVPWAANATGGNKTTTVLACQAGVTYTITYRAYKSGYTPVTAIATYKVNAASTGALAITTTAFSSGVVGTAYLGSVAASGGLVPYTFSINYGPFPPGLTLSSQGQISGTPTVAGTYNFGIAVTDGVGNKTIKPLTIVISNYVATAPQPPPGCVSNANYTFSNNGGLVYVGNTWTYFLYGGCPGDKLEVTYSQNDSPVSSDKLFICSALTSSCTKVGTFSSADIGSWTENIYINGVYRGVISYTVAAPISTTSPPPSTACVSNPSIAFSSNGATLVAARDAWKFTMTNACPGDKLEVGDITKNYFAYDPNDIHKKLFICSVAAGATACDYSAIPQSGDVGNWYEYVYVNGGYRTAVTFMVSAPASTPPPPPAPPTPPPPPSGPYSSSCLSNPSYSFSSNGGYISVGSSWTYSLTGGCAGDKLEVTYSHNGGPTSSSKLFICSVPTSSGAVPYTSCTSSATVNSGDAGSWLEYVYINGVYKGFVNFTVY